MSRRIGLALAGVPVLIIALLIALPWLFRGRAEAAVRAGIERNVDAQVAWGRVHLSLLRDFPRLGLRLSDVSIAGTGVFAGDTLLTVDRFHVVLDLGSVAGHVRRGTPVVIRSIAVDRPAVRLLTLEDGRANWDIMRASEEAVEEKEPAGVSVTLRSLEVRDGSLVVEDRSTGVAASVAGLAQTLSGDWSQTRFVLRSRTSAESVSVRFAGVPYLNSVRLGVDAAVDADLENRVFTLADNEIRLNELLLRSAGSLTLGERATTVDVAFESPRTEFGDILSLVPALYGDGFRTLQTAGTMAVAGRVQGEVGGGAFPSLDITARVADGSFRYPDLPLPARDIGFALSITNAGGSADGTVVRLDGLRLVLGDDPIEGSFTVRTPVSDPDVAFRLAGRLDLEDLRRTVKLEQVQELSGVVVADASMRARQSDAEAGRYERIAAEGGVEVSGMSLQSGDMAHAVHVDRARLRLTPQHAELAEFRARSGGSDVAVVGTVDNLLGYVMRGEVLRGEARVTSSHVDLNEWRSDDEAQAVPVPANVDVAVRADVARVTFGTLDMRNARGSLRVREQRATLDDFRVELLGGSMAVTGFYETTDPQRPTFDMELAIVDVDVPAAFAGVASVRALAPVAAYAQGRMSADLRVAGPLGADMTPELQVLTGIGSLRTSGLVVQGFPVFQQLADRLEIQELRNPGLRDLRSSFEIREGRLHVRPFDVAVGPIVMQVAGSNGLDQSLDYQLALQLPRQLLGTGANRVLTGLAAQTARAGLDLQAADVIGVGVGLAGTVTAPQLTLDLRESAGTMARGVEQALRDQAAERVEAVEQRVDEAAEEARRRAAEEAERIVAEAVDRAAQIREEARLLAERGRQEGHVRADSLVARASSPAARLAAQAAADRIRREADAQAARLVQEADARADALVAEARRRNPEG